MLVNRETGKGLGVTLFDSEERCARRRGASATNRARGRLATLPGTSSRGAVQERC